MNVFKILNLFKKIKKEPKRYCKYCDNDLKNSYKYEKNNRILYVCDNCLMVTGFDKNASNS